MSNTTATPGPGQDSAVPFIDIAGYHAVANYACTPGRVLSRTPEELDRISLEKLWHTGFDVADLDEAHEQWKISPLRSTGDVWGILGHQKPPHNAKGGFRYTEACLTSLAIQYPSLLDRGEVYSHSKICRVRYPEPIYTIRGKGHREGVGVEKRRYDQPLNQSEERSTSEPYFLYGTQQYDRLYDTSLPLLMTEGEFKGAALGLAGLAAIAWGGVHMWAAPRKAGKGKLHPSIDPEGPGKSWAIPVLNRPIYLIPDIDFWSNQMVRKAFTALGNALINAGADPVYLVKIPQPSRPDLWKGIDDYLTHHLGPRWSGGGEKVHQAANLVQDLLSNHVLPMRQTDRYASTSVVRGAERLYDKLSEPNHYTAVLTGLTEDGHTRVGWMTYKDDRYHLYSVEQSIGNTSGKVPVPVVHLQVMAEEIYELGVDQAIADGEITDKPTEMPTDYPNHVLAAVNRRLPERESNTLIEPFNGVDAGDFCIRADRSLINVTKFVAAGGEWARRAEWLLPPDHRWFSRGCVHVSLGNRAEKPECPLFMEMIRNAFDNDAQSIRCLQLWLGKVLCNPKFQGHQQFLALYGEAGSGKSTFYRITAALLGVDNICHLRAQFGNRFDTADLPGKKLAVFQETPDGSSETFSAYMAEVVKNLTGEDTIVYERKGFTARSVRVDADVLMIGNDPPIVPMHAEAFTRRAIFLRMFHKLPVRDSRVEARIIANELEGIFLWALEGAVALFRGEKIRTPDRNRDDLDDVTAAVAPEERYVATQFKLVPAAEASKHRLTNEVIYEHYQNWVRQANGRVRTVNIKRLGILIRQRYGNLHMGVGKVNGHSARYYEGLAFVNPVY